MLAQNKNVGDTPWVLLLFCVALIPSVLNLIPLASLAAVLIYTGYKLAKPSILKHCSNKGTTSFAFRDNHYRHTFTDLLVGIIIGIVVGLFL